MKSCSRFITLITIIASMVWETIAFSQSTIVKLPTMDNNSDFTITDNADASLLKIFGDGGFAAFGTFNSGSIPATGAGTRLMWYPRKAALRAGYVPGTQWDNSNIGNYSTAFGYSIRASGNYSTAIGSGLISSGNYSVTLGSLGTASGYSSVAIGFYPTASGDYSTAMGSNTVASGATSTATGYITTASGDNSTAMGSYVSTNSRAGAFIIGDNSTTSTTSSLADHQMTMRFDGGYRLFTKTDLSTGVTMANGANSWSSVSDYRKKTNYLNVDGEYFLASISKLKLGSWNYKTQDPKTFRHYGPMAQEIFEYFGNDGIGIIGNDTTLATADMDGIIMICLQALEKRTRQLNDTENRVAELERKIDQMTKYVKMLSNENKNLTENVIERREQ